MGLPSFVMIRVAVKPTKSRLTLRKFELIAVQGHPRSSILMPIASAHATLVSRWRHYW